MSQSSHFERPDEKKGERKSWMRGGFFFFWELGHSIAFSVTWHESNASSMEIQAVP